ncbi:hypothetical protein AB838_18850 [Rhodobacteraceae bacterium (ex Bugula neritina AB1)]|nr:hypothetical protein AB838_18850 [Rhodobacteraceae bacterium (ex Bugula neritina AB1)]
MQINFPKDLLPTDIYGPEIVTAVRIILGFKDVKLTCRFDRLSHETILGFSKRPCDMHTACDGLIRRNAKASEFAEGIILSRDCCDVGAFGLRACGSGHGLVLSRKLKTQNSKLAFTL